MVDLPAFPPTPGPFPARIAGAGAEPALPAFLPGSVWLAGAGPGDPGLLTLLARHALALADVVVHDALIQESVLHLARPGAVLECAGKRGGQPSPRQPEISRRLIALAREGWRVLRLKGGDPFVFGRGGEEAKDLVAAGVPYRVVPGVTAGIGGLAYAGIPLTTRETNQCVTFLTGHDASGLMPETVDWTAVAGNASVIVLYMALRHLAAIAARLMAAGRPADEPVAVVANATLPEQRVLSSRLDRCAVDLAASGITAPAIIAIGGVASLRQTLAWFPEADAGR